MPFIIDDIKAFVEVRPLTAQEIELKNQSNADIVKLLWEEELKWYQRSKTQFIFEGNSYMRYFHSIANSRHRKKLIHSLVQDNCTIEGHEHLKSYITNYYKDIFGASEEGNFSLEQMITPRFPTRKIAFLRHNILRME
jgi:hypothetical protein